MANKIKLNEYVKSNFFFGKKNTFFRAILKNDRRNGYLILEFKNIFHDWGSFYLFCSDIAKYR